MKCHRGKGYKFSITDGEFWLDTGWGCGYLKVVDGVIIDSAPIFKKLRGQKIDDVLRNSKYKIERIER